jgi:hypothetical protein
MHCSDPLLCVAHAQMSNGQTQDYCKRKAEYVHKQQKAVQEVSMLYGAGGL